MSDPSRLHSRSGLLLRPLLLVLAVAAAIGLILWIFWPRPLSKPDESRRVEHPLGFSMVVPEHFDTKIGLEPDDTHRGAIILRDGRYDAFPPMITVHEFLSQPDFAAMSKRGFKQVGTFLGRQASIMNGPSGRGRAAMWNYRVIFERDGRWFEVAASDPQFFDLGKSRYRDYLESFRLDPARPATMPSAAPATVPATGLAR
jgi:hypothetical protein